MNFPNQHNLIPISISLDQPGEQTDPGPLFSSDKKRLLYISVQAVVIGLCISVIARFLVILINLITNISFHHQFSTLHSAPAGHHYGIFVIFIPALGGLIVGIMALYGSKAIRGHGIPEAMEQILTNQSKIRPSITFLKPLSSAISIGTGGPFGAEGPIIATGGALGSTIGQLLKISPYERKILLASGATAGMAAIFGSPIAAIFLAIELLLFEFSPRSIIPVALACITGAAGHHFLFEIGPVFPTPYIPVPNNIALALYSIMGLVIGLLAAAITKLVYYLEDLFEHLPVHWMWWPAIGGLVVGIVGYFYPRTLGVGCDNITDIISGKPAMQVILSLCLMKLVSWSVALGSGTSGGTLAPLLTIGGAAGALLGMLINKLFLGVSINIPLSALVGMTAMFAGASRALLTSIIFVLETTEQSNALLPLLSAGIASYFISYLLMENTIMTEKIARRGINTPHEYEPDVLDKMKVKKVLKEHHTVLGNETTIEEARNFLSKSKNQQHAYYIVATEKGILRGIISSSNLFSMHHDVNERVDTLIKRKTITIHDDDTLKQAVQIMARENLDVLPVVSAAGLTITGILSYKDVLVAYQHRQDEHEESVSISLKRRTLKILVHGRRRLAVLKGYDH